MAPHIYSILQVKASLIAILEFWGKDQKEWAMESKLPWGHLWRQATTFSNAICGWEPQGYLIKAGADWSWLSTKEPITALKDFAERDF